MVAVRIKGSSAWKVAGHLLKVPECFGPKVLDLPVNMFLDHLPPEASRAINPSPPSGYCLYLLNGRQNPSPAKIRMQKGC